MFVWCRLVVWLVLCSASTTVHAKVGYFWHITDLHYDPLYSTNGDTRKSCWRSEQGNTGGPTRRPGGRYGDYSCDSPWTLLDSACQAMKNIQGDNVEFVLWTGDGLSHTSRRFSEAHRMDLLRNVTDLLSRTFSSQFVFPVLGHEEPLPLRLLGDMWRHWLPTEALTTFEIGGYYTIEQTKSKLRIVALNTNFMTGAGSSGRGHGEGGDSESVEEEGRRQWEWLEALLAKSQRNKETVYIVGHIPPGVDERQGGELPPGHVAYTDHNNRRYLRLVRKYANIITGQFFGHLHSDSFRVVYGDSGKPVSWLMVSPSVTPRRTSGGANNPGLRLYKFHSDTGQMLDYSQYYLDLAGANLAGEAHWLSEYNFTQYYFGLGEANALALHTLADQFTHAAPILNAYFPRYFRANSVKVHVSPQAAGCESSCAHVHYCAITRLDYTDFLHCLETSASALASDSPGHRRNFYSEVFVAGLLIVRVIYL